MHDLNFFLMEDKSKQKSQLLLKIMNYLIFVVLAVILLINVLSGYNMFLTMNRLEDVKKMSDIGSYGEAKDTLEALKNLYMKKSMEFDYYTLINNLKSKNDVVNYDLFFDLVSLIPEDFIVTNISISGQELTMTASAYSVDDIAGFEETLRKNSFKPSFSNVVLPSIKRDNAGIPGHEEVVEEPPEEETFTFLVTIKLNN